MRRLGADLEVGLQLHRVFDRAGLYIPLLGLSAGVGGGEGFTGHEMAVELVRTLLPAIDRLESLQKKRSAFNL